MSQPDNGVKHLDDGRHAVTVVISDNLYRKLRKYARKIKGGTVPTVVLLGCNLYVEAEEETESPDEGYWGR